MFIASKLELFSLKMTLVHQFLICPEIHLGQVANEKNIRLIKVLEFITGLWVCNYSDY